MDTQHSQLANCVTVSEVQRAILTEDEPVTLTEGKHVDTFSPVPQRIVKFTSGSLIMHQDSRLQTQRRISSQSTRLDIIPEVSSDEEESLDEGDVESSTQDCLQHLRQPPAAIDSEGIPGSLSFWDALDLEINSIPSGYSQVSTAGREEPRGLLGMLRKSRSVIFQDRALSVSVTSTVPSELRIRNKLRKRMRPASTPTLRSPHLDLPLGELPTGVKQTGIDIDFNSMEPVTSHSISVYRSAIRTCKKLVPVIGRKISRQSLRTKEQLTSAPVDLDRSQDAMVVMREIYGPTWTFGIESVPASAGTLTPSATTNDSEGPVTPETPFFDHTVGIMQHKESSTLRLVPPSDLRPLV